MNRLGRYLIGLLAAVALFFAVAPMNANAGLLSDFDLTYPVDGAQFAGPVPDIRGTFDSDLDGSGHVDVDIYRQYRDGTILTNKADGFYQMSCSGLCFVVVFDYDWAWSNEESILHQAIRKSAIPSADGQWRVIAKEPYGERYAQNWVKEITYTIDTMAPETTLLQTPPQYENLGHAVFRFRGDDPAPGSGLPTGMDYFDCQLDDEEKDHCSVPGGRNEQSTYEYLNLPEGMHTVKISAIDEVNNEDQTPATYTWMVDKTKPVISIGTPQPRQRYVLGENVPTDFSCTDPLSGGPPKVASGIATCDAPDKVDTSALGNFTYKVTAIDRAGNVATKEVSYAVDPPRYPDVIHAAGPIAYYRLGDPFGADVMADSSGNHHDGEYKNGVALERPAAPTCERRPHPPHTCDQTADPQDFSAFFPARDGYGFTNDITAPQGAYTLEAWIKRADDGAGSVIGQGGAGQLFVGSDGKLALRQTQDTVPSSGPVLTPGQWFHVAATWDGQDTKLYVNGELVGSSDTANKAPSGSSTLYVGYGDQAPWFHGQIDEAAYYGSALSGGQIASRYVVGTAHDVAGPVDGPPIQRPDVDIVTPPDGALYAPGKTPKLDFSCSDLDGDATVASCEAEIDGNLVTGRPTLPDGPGSHSVSVTATDDTGLTRTHTNFYYVMPFEDIYKADVPLAYYRLGEASGSSVMADSSDNHFDGVYKNAQESGPVGISGDGDQARKFLGSSGYGYTNNITAPTRQGSMEAWVNPDDTREQSVMGQGDAGEIYIEDGLFKFRHMGTTVAAHIGPTPGRFTQVVAVWDGVTISLYVNGELHGQTEATKRPSSSSTFYVGYGEIKPWFKGSLDEVAYYGTALTPDQVMQHFLADPPATDNTSTDLETDPGTDPVTSDDPPPVGDDQPATGDDQPIVGSNPEIKTGTGISTFHGKAKAKKRAKARARTRCRKLNKAKKRRACLRRVNRRY